MDIDAENPHSTRSRNVIIVDQHFPMPELDRSRRIWAYLPPDYPAAGKRYPVLYAHDGQNLFDKSTSFSGEWGIDKIMDSLYAADYSGIIIIGIDNGGDHRTTEYNPYDNEAYGKGEGKRYAEFIVKSLKPFIDKTFRTLPDRENTGILGSSMGGLISFYTWLKYPDVFAKAGVFSPAFWIAPELKSDIDINDCQKNDKVFLIAGDNESDRMVPDMDEIYDILIQKGMGEVNLRKAVVKGAGHCEAYWHKEFAGVLLWLFKSGG